MGLGFNDGFAPDKNNEPLYHVKRTFWDEEELLNEALEVKEKSFSFPRSGTIIRAFPMSEQTPALIRLYKDFLDKFKRDWGEVSVSYMYINAGEIYPWHIDNEITKVTGGNTKGVLCAFNILLSGEENEVEFEGHGKYSYKSAILNTSHYHRVSPKSDRIIARLAFRDYSYEDVVRKISNQ